MIRSNFAADKQQKNAEQASNYQLQFGVVRQLIDCSSHDNAQLPCSGDCCKDVTLPPSVV